MGRDGVRLAGALNIAAADVGDRCETPDGTPRLAGRVERIHQDAISQEVMLRIDQPAQQCKIKPRPR